MNGVMQTVTADTRELEREVIPALLAYGRRTLQEQCVTSATFIAFAWSKGIPFVEIATIDAELEEVVRVSSTPAVKYNGTNSRMVGGLEWTRGMMIAIQRTTPNSKYSVLTGNRWPLAKPDGGMGAYAVWEYYQAAAERMQKSRHSSTHFIQSGVKPIIRQGMESPYYKYNAAFGSRREATADDNKLNTMDSDQLGGMVIELSGDDCVITGFNAVGENEGGSNDVLAAKHRRAAIEYAVPPLNAAIEKEKAAGYAELQRRVDLGWRMKFPEWS